MTPLAGTGLAGLPSGNPFRHGSAMQRYSLTLNTGAERTAPIPTDRRDAAILAARTAFELELPTPVRSYCAVFDGSEPVGRWDFDPARWPAVVWVPETH
jgi:hypothetical protein